MVYDTLTDAQIADFYVVSPGEAYEGARWQEKRYQELPSVEWCTQAMRDNVTPLLAGELCGVLAYSGDGKTSVGLAQAYYTAKQLLAQKKDLTHRVIYYTWDQPTEALELQLEVMVRHDRAIRANVPVSKVSFTKADRIALPLWFAGKSAKKNLEYRTRGIRIPELTVERIGDVLDFICDKGEKEIALLVADYAQRIKTQKNERRFETVLRVAELIGDFVTIRNVPGILLLQANRDVKERSNKVPRIDDIQDSSGLEKILDKGWGQWVPSNCEKEGTPLQVAKKTYVVERGLVVANKFKDRRGPANVEFVFAFDFPTWQIGDYK
jgi:replicative DNA helicase